MPTVRCTDLFWATLQEHRDSPRYRSLRFRLLQFMRAKENSTAPFSGGDRPFTNSALKDIWHLRLRTSPEVTLFYVRNGPETVMAMIGSHADYGFKGANSRAEARTATRVNNAVAGPGSPTPGWETLRWADPLDILNGPDVPEMSRGAMDSLVGEIEAEEATGARFERLQGIPLIEASEGDFFRYMDDLAKAREFVISLMAERVPHRHWLDNVEATDSFQPPRRAVG